MAVTYEPIATTTLGSAQATITFSSIPSTYTDLRLVIVPVVSTGSSDYAIRLNYNSDTATNYSTTLLYGNGTAASSARGTTQAYIQLYGALGYALTPTLYTVDTFSYAGSTNKTCLITQAGDFNGTGSVTAGVGLWRSTSAITSIQILNFSTTQFGADTTATLYGIKAA